MCRAQAFPALVCYALRRLPALQPPALADAAILANKPEYAEAAALESRNELVRLLGLTAAEPAAEAPPPPPPSAAPPAAEQPTPPPSPSAHHAQSDALGDVFVQPS